MNLFERFEALAGPKPAQSPSYHTMTLESLRSAFLDRIDAYLDREAAKSPDWQISAHEAGGAWRIAFSHRLVRPDAGRDAHMTDVMRARRRWARQHCFHGFADEAEVHHEIETFIYFQQPLLYHDLPGADAAAESVLDVAEHVINAAGDVPDWYDPQAHGFRSVYLGTRSVRDYPPFDYQEANHWRFVGAALAAHQATGDRRYIDVAADYARRWSEHIERALADGRPPHCAILPDHAVASEMGFAGDRAADASDYQVFYASVAANTAFDIFTGLTDVWRLTSEQRFLDAARGLLDSFFAHATDGRPATRYTDDRWVTRAYGRDVELKPETALLQDHAFLTRMAVRHDALTCQPRYREPLLEWARAVDEAAFACDQSACDVMAAATWYTGEEDWLRRGLAMALRIVDATESDDRPHMCSARTRCGSRFLLEGLYLPLAGVVDAGTRGGMPILAGSRWP